MLAMKSSKNCIKISILAHLIETYLGGGLFFGLWVTGGLVAVPEFEERIIIV
jgi:hypothetical protein